MANVEHVNIADGERHEPKGAATASDNKSYVSDGAQSGAWEFPTQVLQTTIDDISSSQSVLAVSPFAGEIIDWWTVIDGAIVTDDADLTLEIGGTLVVGSELTIAFTGSAAGIVDGASPTSARTVTAGQAIEVITDGGSTNVIKAQVFILVRGS